MNNIHPIEQKLVPFNGADLLGVKASDGKVYVGVRWVCEGIGLTEDQMKNERKKIQSDLVLKQGGLNLTLNGNGGARDVLTIELDFLPLWLAKISITPNMQRNQPEVAEKLIQYQLKAKDVLAAAFIQRDHHFNNMSPELKAILFVDGKVQQLDSRIGYLENRTTIDYGQQQVLKKAGNAKVIGVLGGKKMAAYKDSGLRHRVYSALWHDYQDWFGINSYNNTYTKDFESGLKYIQRWMPPTNLMREIEEFNGQKLF
ncbi:ORF6C domain-containing protein [Paenibacillus campinasensis]|uniref:Antirepressor protein ant N-terminal domain-containing protein n=1 Tax=Paenibacillus campinasensis TaxID=66347 RepID=A0A268EKQ6_9BACL|nr:ORF6C domain-containing protein [Paenibacillus campinasensis]PAD73698.1 hypothetical protein CHH67_19885 [Paenibacillus campinasensis]